MSSPSSSQNPTSTLSTRGADLAARPDVRENADELYGRNWDYVTNPEGIVNLGTAENSLIMDDIAAFVEAQHIKFEGVDFDYGEGPWGSIGLRTAMSDFLNTNFNPHAPTHPKNLTILSGATSLLSTLALTLANPGEAVLLPAPCYVGFLSDLSLLAGLTPVYVRFLSPVDQFTDVDHAIRCFEEARERAEEQGTNVKMVVLCNPHNPLGRCYTKDMLMGVMRFCGKWGIHLVVDEVYAMSVYSTACATDIPFTSILSLNSTPHIAPTHLHQIYSLSKDFASGGLRIASLHTHNNLLQRAISRLAILHHSGTIPSLLAIAILSPPPPSTFHNIFFTTSRARLARAAELAKSLLDEAGIRYASSSNAGFFLWIDLRPWLRGEEEDDEWEREKGLSARMEVEKVFIIGGRVQGAGEAGWYRFIFSRNEQVVREGVERLVRALGKRA